MEFQLYQFDQIAFFWVGNDISVPSFLVKSLKLVYNNKVKIFHLTNFTTKKIIGTTKTIRLNLPQDIMLARLQAYRDFPYNNKLTFFCDADSLFIKKLDLFNLKQDIYLIKRSDNFIINHNWPELYPEFKDKYIMEVMPYLFGGMAFTNGKAFLTNLLNTCLDLPERFHRWYGDQYSLKINVEKNKYMISFLPIELYLNIVRQTITNSDFKNLVDNNVKLITFKGPDSKKYIEQSYNNLVDYYKKEKFSQH